MVNHIKFEDDIDTLNSKDFGTERKEKTLYDQLLISGGSHLTAKQLRDAQEIQRSFTNDNFAPVKLNFSNDEIKEESEGEAYLD